MAALVSGGAEPLVPCWQCRALWRAFEGLKHQGHVAGLCGSLELRGSREKRKHRRLVFREKADGRSDEAWGLFQAGVLTAGICKAFGMVAALQGAQPLWRAVQVKVSWYSVFYRERVAIL